MIVARAQAGLDAVGAGQAEATERVRAEGEAKARGRGRWSIATGCGSAAARGSDGAKERRRVDTQAKASRHARAGHWSSCAARARPVGRRFDAWSERSRRGDDEAVEGTPTACYSTRSLMASTSSFTR